MQVMQKDPACVVERASVVLALAVWYGVTALRIHAVVAGLLPLVVIAVAPNTCWLP